MLIGRRTVEINSEAFNALREKDIAKDIEKLLKLAIALKTELDNRSRGEASADALTKANEIEKLAKQVKGRVCINPPSDLY